ncbi:MAG: calcium/sodium antiporter [Candidatus Bathyarchaeia archaeon]
MPSLFTWLLIFGASLVVLAKASDYFIASAQTLGKFFKIPPFIIGVLIISLGTSLPELVVSLLAIMQQSSEVVIGNVIGSNIANIFLVLGLTAIIGKRLKLKYENVHVNFLIGATFLLSIAIWDRRFTLPEAIFFIALVIVYLHSSIRTERRAHARARAEEKEWEKETIEEKFDRRRLFVLFLSPIFIFLGARYTVESLIVISEMLNIEKEVIAVSFVALGTSLPELMVTLSLSKKGQLEVAVGNILGSNVFNILLVIGLSGLVGVLQIPQRVLSFDLPIMVVATLLFFFITRDRDIKDSEGWMLLIFYGLFIGKVLNLF